MTAPSRLAIASTDPRVQAAWREYMEAVDRGETIEVERFLAGHPAAADELRSLIAFDEETRRLMGSASPKGDLALAQTIRPKMPKAEVSTHSVAGKVVETSAVKPPIPAVASQGKAVEASMARRSVVATPPKSPLPKSANDLPDSFGRYQVQQKLGEGAMGAVYLAVDSLLQRKVALKTPTFDDDTDGELLRRFHREARAVANLKHPNLCAVYDVGEIDGRHYISMEFVPGKKLQEFIKADKPMSEKQAMAVVRKIALGMQEAHSHGVIHRDLKPDNIMVNEKGEPVVMDFGLVHKTDQQNSTRITQRGTLIGSPAYMSKEQVEGDPDTLTVATDQYSLGVILYQLLTSKLPFEGGIHAVLGAILTREPPPPSQHRPDLNPHLEAVCLKMMAKEAQNRYPSMKAAADALAEVAKGTSKAAGSVAVPVQTIGSLTGGLTATFAGIAAPSKRSRSAPLGVEPLNQSPIRQFLAEHPNSLLYGSLAAGLALLWAVILLFRSGDALVKVTIDSDDVEVTFQDLSIKLKDGSHEYKVKPGDHTLHIKCGNAEFDTDKFTLKKGNNPVVTVELVKSEIVSRLGTQEIGRHHLSAIPLSSRQNAKPVRDPDWEPANVRELATLSGHTNGVTSVAFSPNENRLASVSWDNTVKVWDTTTGQGQQTLTLTGHTGAVKSVVFSPDGKRLASASDDKTVKVWDATSGHTLLTLTGHTGGVTSVAFSPDGNWLASAGDTTVRVWDATSSQELLTFKGHTDYVHCVAFSPDGMRLASAAGSSRDGSVNSLIVWDATNGEELLTLKGHTTAAMSVSFSPDGSRLASASTDRTVKVWDTKSGQEMLTMNAHANEARSVVFSPDGKRLVSAGDTTLKVWDAASGQQMLALKGHTGEVMSVAFSPDGKRLASASLDQTVKIWGADRTKVGALKSPAVPKLVTLSGHTGQVYSVAFSADGKRLASASADRTVKVWDATNGQETLTLKGLGGEVKSVAFNPDGKRLASASADMVKVWDVTNGQETLTLKGDTLSVNCVAFSPDGTRLASASAYRTVMVWDATSGQETLTLNGDSNGAWSVVFSPDGNRLASASYRTVKVWDTTSGQETLTLKGHLDGVTSVAFSPDGKWLASASTDRTVKVWDATSGQAMLTLFGHTSSVMSVAFSPDGKWLASASDDKTVKVWDATSGQETLTLKGHLSGVNCVVFSPDGKRLASASDDQMVKVWDVDPTKAGALESPVALKMTDSPKPAPDPDWAPENVRELATLFGHTEEVTSVAFSPDGKRLVSAGVGPMKVWDATSGEETLTMKGHPDQERSVAFSPDGERLASASEDGTAKVWDTTTGKETLTLNGHTYSVNSVAFSQDGKRLASASVDGTVRIRGADRTKAGASESPTAPKLMETPKPAPDP